MQFSATIHKGNYTKPIASHENQISNQTKKYVIQGKHDLKLPAVFFLLFSQELTVAQTHQCSLPFRTCQGGLGDSRGTMRQGQRRFGCAVAGSGSAATFSPRGSEWRNRTAWV